MHFTFAAYDCNNGLAVALKLLTPIKEEFPDLSWSDLIQLGSAVSIEHANGPHVPIRLGRMDADGPDGCAPDERLPVSTKEKLLTITNIKLKLNQN